MIKRKFFGALVIACLLPLCMQAEGTPRLVVSLIDGTTVELALGDMPSVTFSGNQIHVESSLLTADYPTYRVSDFHFEDAVDVGIKLPDVAGRNRLQVDYRDGSEVVIRGIDTNRSVRLYSANGTLLRTMKSPLGEELHISTANLVGGVYIVTIEDITSLKLTVR